MERFQVVAANGIANFQTTTLLKEAQLPFDFDLKRDDLAALLPFSSTIYAEQIGVLNDARGHLLPRLMTGRLSLAHVSEQAERACAPELVAAE